MQCVQALKCKVFLLGGWQKSTPTSRKLIFPHQIFIFPIKCNSPKQITIFMLSPKKSFIFSHFSSLKNFYFNFIIFLLTGHVNFHYDVQYLENVVISFDKDLNGQNHSSSDSYYLTKNIPHVSLQGLFSPTSQHNLKNPEMCTNICTNTCTKKVCKNTCKVCISCILFLHCYKKLYSTIIIVTLPAN